jgi:hypothetical protein
MLAALKERVYANANFYDLVMNDVRVVKNWPRIECTRCNNTGKFPTAEGLELIDWMKRQQEAKRNGTAEIPF